MAPPHDVTFAAVPTEAALLPECPKNVVHVRKVLILRQSEGDQQRASKGRVMSCGVKVYDPLGLIGDMLLTDDNVSLGLS
jgi:hypothetical protein